METVPIHLEHRRGKGGRVALSVLAGDQQVFTHLLDILDADIRADFMKRLREKCENEKIRGITEDCFSEIASKVEELAAESVQEDTSKKSQADLIFEIAVQHYRIGQNHVKEPFAVVKDGPNIARMLRGGHSSLRAELAARYCEAFDKVPGSGALTDALMAVEGMALRQPQERTNLRLGRHGNAIILDLGRDDGKAIVISDEEWTVVERSPILFHRTELIAPLPIPVSDPRGLDELKSLLNVSEESWPLVTAWLVSVLIPDIPHPIVLLSGLHGSGKSTNGRNISAVIDPSPAPLRTPPRDIEQWGIEAAASWVVPVDNVSSIKYWWSDALCRASTGDGLIRRRLYTDSDLSVLAFHRCVILTSIDPGALKGDLADRLLIIELDPISPAQRRTEEEMRRVHSAMHPRILGGLLDLVVKVFGVLPSIRLDDKPRMADFAHVLAALDHVQGTQALGTYLGQGGTIAHEVVEGDSVAVALTEFAQSLRTEWSGTAGELLKKITTDKPPRDWPRNPKALGSRIRRVIPALGSTGIVVIPPRGGRDRTWRIPPTGFDLQTTVETVQCASDDHNPLLDKKVTEEGKQDGSGDGSQGSSMNRPTNRRDVSTLDNSNLDGSDGSDGCMQVISGQVVHAQELDREEGRI